MESEIIVICAMDHANGIGVNNTLPWKLREDMEHFKKTTKDATVVMGRKTLDSIGKPLPSRKNIVITRGDARLENGVIFVNSLSLAIAQARKFEKTIFIIGGAQIYQEAILICDKMIITKIHDEYACDSFFPNINEENWNISKMPRFTSDTGITYTIETYERASQI